MTETRVIEWRVWPARSMPGRAAAVVAVVAAAAGAALLLFHHVVAVLATALLLGGAVGEFLLPTRYRLTADGAEARNLFFWRRIEWGEVKRVYSTEEEIKLSPLPHAGRQDAFRGVMLRCDGNRDVLLDAIRNFRDAAA